MVESNRPIGTRPKQTKGKVTLEIGSGENISESCYASWSQKRGPNDLLILSDPEYHYWRLPSERLPEAFRNILSSSGIQQYAPLPLQLGQRIASKHEPFVIAIDQVATQLHLRDRSVHHIFIKDLFGDNDAGLSGVPSRWEGIQRQLGTGMRQSEWKNRAQGNLESAIAEMDRVLKPGGRIRIIETLTPENVSWNHLIKAFEQKGLKVRMAKSVGAISLVGIKPKNARALNE